MRRFVFAAFGSLASIASARRLQLGSTIFSNPDRTAEWPRLRNWDPPPAPANSTREVTCTGERRSKDVIVYLGQKTHSSYDATHASLGAPKVPRVVPRETCRRTSERRARQRVVASRCFERLTSGHPSRRRTYVGEHIEREHGFVASIHVQGARERRDRMARGGPGP